MKAKWAAAALAVAVLFYLLVLGQRGWVLVTSGRLGGLVLGVGVLLLPALVGWAVVRELRFGAATERMARRLAEEGGLPVDDLPRTPSGRVEPSAADGAYERYRAETEAAPEDWRTWFRLACAYDLAGDRRRARAAMRHAVSLFG